MFFFWEGLVDWYAGLNWKLRYGVALFFILLGGVPLLFSAIEGGRVSRLAIVLFLLGLVLAAVGGRSSSEKNGYRF